MVSKTLSHISKVWGLISGGFLLLVSLFPDDIRKLIISTFGISSEVFVFWALVILAVVGIVSSVIILMYGLTKKSDVILQKGSLRFNKYPYLVRSKQGFQRMPNMVYAEITIENRGKVKAECEVEITLKGNGTTYRSKVLSADSTKTPNPMTISVDANGGTVGFHPLCLKLETLEAFLPNHSLRSAGVFSGTLVRHNQYELLGRVIYDQEQSKIISLGKVKIPDDFLKNAKIPNDIQVIMEQGGFAIYLECCQGKVRAKFYGHNNDDDTKGMILDHLEKIPNIDEIIEDNGRLRHWEIITTISNGGIRQVNLIDVEELLS